LTGPRLSASSVAVLDRSHHSSQKKAVTDPSCHVCAVRAAVTFHFPFGLLRLCAWHASLGLIPAPFDRKLWQAVSV
jgi:hypothetical protein